MNGSVKGFPALCFQHFDVIVCTPTCTFSTQCNAFLLAHNENFNDQFIEPQLNLIFIFVHFAQK